MTENFEGSVTCPKCGHDGNAATALKCEICGHQLQKKSTSSPKPFIFGAIILLGILGSGSYFLFKDKLTTAQTQDSNNVVSAIDESTPESQTTSSNADASADSPERYSSGEQILLRYKSNADAKNGVREFAAGNDDKALEFFEKAVEGDRPNPEPQIYLNNTKARLAAESPFKLAVVVPVDNSATSAEEILRGVADAQTKFNEAGGLNGQLLEIAIANDGNEPNIAEAVARKLSDNPEILGVIGHNASDASKAALPIYEKNGLAMVSSTSTSTSLSSKVFFRSVASNEIIGKSLAKYASSSGLKKVAVFYNPQSSYSKSLEQSFTDELQKLGGQIIQAIDMSNPSFSPKEEIAALQDRVDAIILFPNKDLISAAIGVARANNELASDIKIPILGGDTMYDPMTITAGGNAVEGLALVVPWFAQTPYAKKAETRWLGQVNWRTATSYDATMALVKALSENSSRESVVQNLQSVELVSSETSGDNLKFSAQRERVSEPTIVKIARGTGGPSGSSFAFKPIQ